MEGGIGGFDAFLALFSRGRKGDGDGDGDGDGSNRKPIPQLSQFADSVVARCSRIILLSTEELQQKFEKDCPDHLELPTYARNLLEYCSFQALHVLTKNPNYLADKEFRRLSYDMMLAWEAPGNESAEKENVCDDSQKIEDEDDGSFFYTSPLNMAVQVDGNKTVGAEAFARIAVACPAIADIITAHNLYAALTSSSSGQLHFLIYDKYIATLDRVYRSIRNLSMTSVTSGLRLAKGEIIIDVDGPTQPVFQHIGLAAWPGRLTLTNRALYFEALGVGSYDKPVVYDLATDLKQVIKPELTGPLGARLFDRAVMYKSNAVDEAVYFEFPEFKGHSRRDYWLAAMLEVTYVNKFIRKFELEGVQQAEAFSKAILGILQYRAVKEVFYVSPSRFKTILSFNLAEELPKGDEILEALYNHLQLLRVTRRQNVHGESLDGKKLAGASPVSLQTLTRLGLLLFEDGSLIEKGEFLVTDVILGGSSPLEMAVKQSLCHSGPAEAARATVEQVKVEGIDTNMAVMKELLFPVLELNKRLKFLSAWEDPFKSTAFLLLMLYVIHRGWIRYALPSLFCFIAILMLWHKHSNQGMPLKAFKVTVPPSRNPVEQLLALQEAISQFEALIQSGNIVLLKIRAILLAALPQATDRVAILLIGIAVALIVVPLKLFVMLAILELYTKEMPLRKDLSEKFDRRIREWWIHIPAAPVELVKVEDSKKNR